MGFKNILLTYYKHRIKQNSAFIKTYTELYVRLLVSTEIRDMSSSSTIDNTQPTGPNPISSCKVSVQFLGYQTSVDPETSFSHRDLGFTGSISGKWFALYGDALWCDCLNPGPPRQNQGCPFKGMVRNAVSACLLDERDQGLRVRDLHLEPWSGRSEGDTTTTTTVPSCRQRQFVPFREDWGEDVTTGFGGTSIVETDREKGEGAVYYLVVSTPYTIILTQSRQILLSY